VRSLRFLIKQLSVEFHDSLNATKSYITQNNCYELASGFSSLYLVDPLVAVLYLLWGALGVAETHEVSRREIQS